MKETPQESNNSNTNFAEVSKQRQDLRKAIKELGEQHGSKSTIFEKHYEGEIARVNEQVAEFKIADFGGLSGAKEALRKQEIDYERRILDDHAQIDYEEILRATPEIAGVREIMKDIADLRDFRVRRLFELQDLRISIATQKRNEAVLKTVREEIEKKEEELDQVDPLSCIRLNFSNIRKI